MAAEYTLPDNLIFSDITLTQEIPTFTNESINYKVKSQDRGIHRLSGTMDVTIEDLEDQRAYIGFLAKCKGRSGTFEVDLPLHFKSTDSTNPQISVAAAVGDITLQLSSFTGVIRAGTFFNMPNDDKCYMVTEDCFTGGTLQFFPAMRQSHLVNSVVEVRSPVIVARFTADNQTVNMIEAGQIITTSIDWQEAL